MAATAPCNVSNSIVAHCWSSSFWPSCSFSNVILAIGPQAANKWERSASVTVDASWYTWMVWSLSFAAVDKSVLQGVVGVDEEIVE